MNNDSSQMNIEVPSEISAGKYSNMAVITHSKSEFVLDFASVLPGNKSAVVNSRLIMTPDHVKRLFYALNDNIAKYEAQFGKIDLGEPKGTLNLADFQPQGGAKS